MFKETGPPAAPADAPPVPAPPPVPGPATGSTGLAGRGHPHLLAVDEHPRQVDPREVGLRGGAARGVDGIGHPRPHWQVPQPRPAHLPDDVHHHLGGRGHAVGCRGRTTPGGRRGRGDDGRRAGGTGDPDRHGTGRDPGRTGARPATGGDDRAPTGGLRPRHPQPEHRSGQGGDDDDPDQGGPPRLPARADERRRESDPGPGTGCAGVPPTAVTHVVVEDRVGAAVSPPTGTLAAGFDAAASAGAVEVQRGGHVRPRARAQPRQRTRRERLGNRTSRHGSTLGRPIGALTRPRGSVDDPASQRRLWMKRPVAGRVAHLAEHPDLSGAHLQRQPSARRLWTGARTGRVAHHAKHPDLSGAHLQRSVRDRDRAPTGGAMFSD